MLIYLMKLEEIHFVMEMKIEIFVVLVKKYLIINIIMKVIV